jgi:ABC-type glycerol-3-phosphate transport system substrate-binding protein
MKFQYIFLTVFGLVAVISVIVFAKAPGKGSSDAAVAVPGVSGNVVIWGTFSEEGGLTQLVNDFNSTYKKVFTVTYAFHDPKNFDSDIVEALASGTGPDIILLPDDLIMRHTDKIELIPYASVPQRDFQALFIQAAEIYMRDQGVIALPFAVDPMVMYWNRDLFNNSSVTQPPKYWDEFLSLAPKLTKRDPKTTDITQSAVAFGEYVNIDNAKDIIAMLFLQVGNPIISLTHGKAKMELFTTNGQEVVPDQDIISAFRFYMDFSNPLKSIYSWNRARSGSRDEFINGNLAVYFGFASDYKPLQQKNPHLNFAVAPIPIPRETKIEITFARLHGLAVLKSSRNKPTAFYAIRRLLETKPSGDFAAAFSLPPVRRDLLANRPTDSTLSVFYDSAIRSRTWLDPKPEESDKAFRLMVESVSSGKNTIDLAIIYLNTALDTLLKPYKEQP